jgi:putative methionine-R-sulfoxide reductase with GAF domain
MAATKSQPQLATEEALRLVELTEKALVSGVLEEFVEGVLPDVARTMQSSSALVYIADSRLPAPQFFQQGFQPEATSELENVCAERFDQISSQPDVQPFRIPPSPDRRIAADLVLYPLQAEGGCVGLMGLIMDEDVAPISSDVLERLLSLLARAISRLAERAESERQLSHLNTYLTVSSMLAQSLDLHELLEVALYCCMEVASAEAASVLLLDDEKENFNFYQVEGPAKPVLMAATFPSDKGIAGTVLHTQQSEIINDVYYDRRFYETIDSASGFQTRNMIAIPLVAGEEQIGVLEVLNKANGGPFTGEECLLLVSLAEEIAFAIRNARVFEYVVNTYCKQRQGQMSCKGCKRPLGSWTPCVKYREASI